MATTVQGYMAQTGDTSEEEYYAKREQRRGKLEAWLHSFGWCTRAVADDFQARVDPLSEGTLLLTMNVMEMRSDEEGHHSITAADLHRVRPHRLIITQRPPGWDGKGTFNLSAWLHYGATHEEG